jgi:hypothetical protein
VAWLLRKREGVAGRFLFFPDITSAPGEIRTPDLLVRRLI